MRMICATLSKDPGKITYIIVFFTLFAYSCNSSLNKEKPNNPVLSKKIIDSANTLLNGGRIKETPIYIDSAYNNFHDPGPVDLWKKYSHNINFYLNYEFNLSKAKLYSDSMFMVMQGKRDLYKKEYAQTIFLHADLLMASKKYAEAFKQYYDGREFVRKNLDNCNISEFTNKLGFVRFKQGQYLKAVPFLKRALMEDSTCKASSSSPQDLITLPQSTLNAIALCFDRANMSDSAIYYYKSALSIIDEHKDSFVNKQWLQAARGVIYGNLGGVYSALNKYGEAEQYLKKSIQINDRKGFEIQDAQTAKVKLANMYINHSNFTEASKLLDELQAHLTANSSHPANESIRTTWYKLKWIYFDKTKNISQAYAYLRKYQKVQDSIEQVNKDLKNADIDIVFKENEQQHNLALLNKDSELKTGYLVATIVFALMLVFILTAVWQSGKRLKKLNTKVIDQNSDMQKTLYSLEQSQEENTRMMKIVAHDLRSPIAATISIASMLLENDNLPAEDMEMLELMKTSSLHSIEMIADLLNMNTTATGLKKEPVEMHTLLQYCVDLLKFKASDKGQKIVLETEKIIINVNREKIWRVISNLIVNAIKFSQKGSVIDIKMHEQQDFVQIRIQDDGIGIPEELKDKIFNIFTDAKRPGTSGEQSFGLGLAISRQIVEAHGGSLWFESNSDAGTIFYVKLPTT